MFDNPKCRVVAIEEHYWDPALTAEYGRGSTGGVDVQRRLDDLGTIRVQEMDAAGIDMQVLSLGAPSLQRFDPDRAAEAARAVNDRLHAAIKNHPGRFAAFAALPTPDPEAAADELERTVTKLGFKGAMIHGLTNGAFLDERRFWPIFERAQALDVPLYLHPAVPDTRVVEAYYRDYLQDFPSLLTAGWGFTVETATQAIRMVLSGAFEAYPGLKIILGHMGEGLPFLLWRLDHAFSRPGNARSGTRPISFREEFSQHVWITTSGNFSTPALLCSMMELGVDRILFSVDYPFVQNPPGTAWLQSLQISAEDRAKIASGNAKRLLKL
jgi:2,3-dihydroxybenzoate decarboxylase